MLKSLIAVVCSLGFVAACGSSGESAKPGKDWSGKELKVTIKEKVNNVEFTIEAPEGMLLEDAAEKKPDDISRRWRADMDDYFSEPGIRVSYESIPPDSLERFIKGQMIDKKNVIAKQEKLADGYVVIHHTASKGLVYATVMKTKGEHNITCSASQAKSGGIPSPDKTIPWLEKICMSLAIQ